MLKDFIKKIDDFTNKAEKKLKKEEETPKKSGGFKSTMRILFKPYDLLFSKLISFCLLAVVFCFACMSLVSISYNVFYLLGENIYIAMALIIFSVFLVLAASVLFMQKWYNICFLHEKLFFFWFNRQSFWRGMIFMAVFLVSTFLPMISIAVLYNREPNPQWEIELLVFTFYLLIAVIPFLVIRYLAWLAFLFRGEKAPDFKETWQKTGDSIRSIILSFLIIILFVTLFFSSSVNMEGLRGSFWRYFTLSLFVGLLTASAEVQRIEFFTDEKK